MARSTEPTRSSSTHVETDGFGPIEVAADRHCGAQSECSRQNFHIGRDRMPLSIHALGIVRPAAAEANGTLELLGGELGSKKPAHQNDHVDISPSSNDSFPTAMHIAAALRIAHDLVPALSELHHTPRATQKAFAKIVKLGRACTQNATPLTLGQQSSDYAVQLERGTKRLELALTELIPPKKEPGYSIMSVLAHGMIHSIQRLAASARTYTGHYMNNTPRELIERSLIKVTALAPKIGCDNAAKMTKSTHARGITLKETAVPHGFLARAYFDRLVPPAKMKLAS